MHVYMYINDIDYMFYSFNTVNDIRNDINANVNRFYIVYNNYRKVSTVISTITFETFERVTKTRTSVSATSCAL